MSDKQGTSWIQSLNKQQVIDELEKKGTIANEQFKLDELRRMLREKCKKRKLKTGTGKQKIAKGRDQRWTKRYLAVRRKKS